MFSLFCCSDESLLNPTAEAQVFCVCGSKITRFLQYIFIQFPFYPSPQPLSLTPLTIPPRPLPAPKSQLQALLSFVL